MCVSGRQSWWARICLICAVMLLASCAVAPNGERNPDPLEAVNRVTYTFNKGVDRYLLRPVASGYAKVMPRPIRRGVSNFFSNLAEPTVIVNGLLQAKFTQAASDVGRFSLNTTIGLLGFFDVASDLGLTKHDESFGTTFGRWGMGHGTYLVLPFFGPSSIRDGVGTLGDTAFYLPTYIKRDSVRWGLTATWAVDKRQKLLPFDEALKIAPDEYLFVRDAYLQSRYMTVYGEPAPLEEPDLEGIDFDDLEDF